MPNNFNARLSARAQKVIEKKRKEMIRAERRPVSRGEALDKLLFPKKAK